MTLDVRDAPVFCPFDEDVVELLREDLRELGNGVPRATVATVGHTRFPHTLIRRLLARGLVIDVRDDRYVLYSEPASTGAPAPRRGLPPAVVHVRADVPVEAGPCQLSLLEAA